MQKTTDLWLSSFLMLKGYAVQEYNVVDKHRGIFFFDIEDDNWKKLKLEFSDSDVSKIKYFQEKLKDLIF